MNSDIKLNNVIVFELEDIIRDFIGEGKKEFYIEDVVNMWDFGIEDTLALLSLYVQKDNGKLYMFYTTLCPNCESKLGYYTLINQVIVGQECYCKDCGVFLKDLSNTYIVFRISDDWFDAVIKCNSIKKKRRR